MSIRWRIADYLSRVACWLRGHKWYIADTWHGVPGNKASELEQQIWMEIVCLTVHDPAEETQDATDKIHKRLTELSQMAGANWGHILPKEKP